MTDYQLNIIINGDASGLDATVASIDGLATATQTMGASATNAASQSGNFFSGLLGNLANIKAGIDMFAGLGGAVIGVGQSLIAGSAEFEGYEARFASLMGSTDAAKDKIQELSTFASTTPFELPDVIKASQSLQVFGGSALNTKENLAVVGNAAAATGQNIGDVSFWFARAYSAIQNGQPFGEAAQNLQQMGVMSGDTVVKLDALKNSGASNQQVWEAFAGSLNAPTDAMAKMGGTWTGLTSTLSDSWSLLVRTFGQPLFDELKPQMQGVIDQLSSSGLIDAVGQLGTAFASVLAPAISFVAGTVIPGVVAAIQFIAPAVSEAINILSQVGAIFGELAGQAMGWGQNIISQLAGGMMDAAAAVMSVLHSIGGMIADLLMPGSPPKLLPELDTWGAGAMSAYLEGWGQADFGVFNSISDSIKGALDGIAKASGDKGMNIASIMLGSQDDIAKAINEVHQFGKVSEETFNGLISAIGPAGPEVSGLVSAYLDLQAATQNVASAQQELNSVTDEYAAKLSPLNAQLKGIQNQKQAIQDQKKLADLQTKLADQSLSDADRQMAMLEQQEIMTRQQIRTTEAERDTAVGASKAKLDAAKQEQAAAQARVNQQKALVDAQNKTNALIAEQSKAMAGAAGAMKGAAAAAAPLSKAVEGVNAAIDTGRQVVGGARDSIEAVSSSFFNVRAAIGSALTVVQPFFGALYQIGDAIGAFAIGVNTLSQTGAVLESVFGATIGGLITQAIGVLNNYATVWIDLGTTIFNVLSALVSGDFSGAWAALTSGLAQVVTDYEVYAASIGQLIFNLGTTILSAITTYAPLIAAQFLTWGQSLLAWIEPYIPIVLTALATFATQIYTWITTQAPLLLAQFLTWGQSLVDWITPYAALAITTLSTWLTGLWAWAQQQAPGWLATLGSWGMALVDWATPYLSLALTTLSTWVGGLWAWVQEQAPGWLAQLGAWGTALAEWIGPAIPPALAALGELATSAFAWVGEQAAPLLASFSAWASSIVEWIPGAVVSFLAEWPGMLSSFLDWIASAAGPILARLGDWAISFINWVGPALPGILAAVGGIAAAILVFIAETVGVLLGKLAEWGPPFSAWVHEKAIPALQGQLANLGKSIVEWIGGAIKWLGDEAAKIGTSVVDGIKQGLSAGWGKVTSWLAEKVASIPAPIRAIMGIHSPSKVMADLVGVPIAQGIGAGFGQAFPKVEKNLINGIAGLSESAAKALDAGAKAISAAASYSGPGGSGLSGFLAAFADMAIQFNDAALMLGGRILGTATRFAETIGKVAGSIGPAVEGLEALQTFVAPSRSAMLAFTAAMSEILTLFKEVAYALTDSAIKYAAKFAESAGKILGVVEVGAKAIAALADLPTLAPGMTQTFANKVAWIVSRLAEVGAWMNGSALSNAATFAEGAGKVLAMVGTGVDAFAKLNTFVKPIDGVVQLFTNKVTWLMTRFAEVGAWMRGPILSAAVAFADGAATVLGVLETGVAGFAALNTFVRPLPGIAQAFTTAVYWLITRFVEAGAGLRAQGLAAATAFADASSKVTGMIGGAVDAFAKLREFVAPAQATVAAFGASLRAALATLIGVMKSFTAEAITAAGAFGEGAGKAVAFIGNAVDGFTKLADFQGVGQAAIDSFGVALRTTLQNLIGVMNAFAADAVAAAGKFGDGAGKAVSFIGNAVGSFLKLAEFTGVGQAAIDAFGAGLRTTLQALIGVAQSFAVDAVAAAAAFGEGAGKALAFIGNAVDGFTKLQDMGRIGQDHVNAFSYNIVIVVGQLRQLSYVFTVEALAAVGAFSDAVSKAVAGLGGAADSLGKLADVERLPVDAVNAWSYNVVIVVGQIRQLAKVFSTDALAAAAMFSASVSALVADVMTSMDAFATLGDAKRMGGDVLKSFMASAQSLVAQMNAYLPPSATIIGQNTVIGLINGIVSQRGALITAMVNTVMAAVMAARQTLGIASPSKVFEQIGQYAGAGLQGGMAAMQPAIAATSAGLGISAVNATTSALRPSGGGTTNNNQRSVVIEAGAIVINGAGGNPRATADATIAEINKRLGMQGT